MDETKEQNFQGGEEMEYKAGNSLDLSILKQNVLSDLDSHMNLYRDQAKRFLCSTVDTKYCPICTSTISKHIICINGFNYKQCVECSHVYNTVQVTEEALREFYSGTDEPVDYSATYTEPEIQEYRLEKVARPKVQFIDGFVRGQPGAWLDVACGNGDVMSVAKELGYRVVGIEPSSASAAFARRRYGQEVHESTIEQYEPEAGLEFDIVSMLGLLDIVSDPVRLLKKAGGLIKPGGIVAASFPNFNSLSTSVQMAFSDQGTCRHLSSTVINMYTPASADRALREAELIPEASWYYGMDIYELTTQLTLANPRTRHTGVVDLLFKYMNEFQIVLDESRQSDEFLVIARKAC